MRYGVLSSLLVTLLWLSPLLAQTASKERPPQKTAPSSTQKGQTPQGEGVLVIDTQPKGAEVYRDGKLLAVTPAKIKLPAGKFKIYLFKKDYLVRVLTGTLEAGKTLYFREKLIPDIPIPHGVLLKLAPKFVSSRKEALRLFQIALIYLLHFHVDAPKESQLILGAIQAITKGLNQIRERTLLLRRNLPEEERKALYVEDVDLTVYPPLQVQEERASGLYRLKLALPQRPSLQVSFSLKKRDTARQLLAFQQVFEYVQKHYDRQDKISENALFFLALQGMIDTLDDGHTRLIPPATLKEMQTEVAGEFGGVGIVISQGQGYIQIVSPMDGTPAMKAGILEGDRIIKIGEKSTRNMNLFQAVRLLRGKPGTKVTITIQRGAVQKTITLTRAIIKLKYVKGKMVTPHIGMIRITSFMGKSLPQQFTEEFNRLRKKGMKALILDLRNNPGGLLDNAKQIGSFFLPAGKVVVSTKGRSPTYTEVLRSTKEAWHDLKIPIVVLINKGSASASEIVAGALQDYRRAVLVGETSFGKGSVQRVFPIQAFQTAFAITVAKYYLPKGRCIHKLGIRPDFEIIHPPMVKLKIRMRSIYSHKEEKINDLHLKKALEILRAKLSPPRVSTSPGKKE